MEKREPIARKSSLWHLSSGARPSSMVGLASEQVRRVFEVDPLRSLFYFLLRRQDQCVLQGWGMGRAYYEFGVGRGDTMESYLRALKAFCRHTGTDPTQYQIYGFDSFSGLPRTGDSRDLHPMWKPGDHAASQADLMRRFQRGGFAKQLGSIHLIEGLFEESLTAELRKQLAGQVPSIINIDVDYYSSTVRVLDWLSPLMHSGTVIYFDDIWDFHGHPAQGELGAVNEFNKSADGRLVPFDRYGTLSTQGLVYIYCRSKYEYTSVDSLEPIRLGPPSEGAVR